MIEEDIVNIDEYFLKFKGISLKRVDLVIGGLFC